MAREKSVPNHGQTLEDKSTDGVFDAKVFDANANGTKASLHPTPEAIRERAYEIYLARGTKPGTEIDDWAQAKRELRKAARTGVQRP